uniref:DUF4515 domain-containing protein n=1 Tax=Steinernema glaseri TaxID=37863 RepID=A0A1I7ZHR3_9BILA
MAAKQNEGPPKVGRRRGVNPSKNAEAVRRHREKKDKEVEELKTTVALQEEKIRKLTEQNQALIQKDQLRVEENWKLKAENQVFFKKIQQQGAVIEGLRKEEITVDPRSAQPMDRFGMPYEPIYNRRNLNGDYPRPITVQQEPSATMLYSEYDYGDYQNMPI